MVILNFHIARELLSNSVGYFTNWQCEPLTFSEDERSMAIARAIWWFYISKAVEMLVGGGHFSMRCKIDIILLL